MILFCLVLFAQYSVAADRENLIPAEQVKILEGGDELGLRHPSDVLVTPDKRILVLDGVSNRVVIYSESGEFLGTLGKGGKGDGELAMPLGMTIDAGGNLYIADSKNARVQIYSSDGKYQSHIDLPYEEGMKQPDPTDVAVDNKRGFLYVVDNENHRVLTYGLADKKHIRTIGGLSHTEDGFRWPFSLFVDQEGIVYVVDVVNAVVRTLLPDNDWKLSGSIGRWGMESGEFFRPKGVAVNASGQVFVSDSYFGVIQVFDRNGVLLGILGDGQKVRRFVTPTRLHIDSKGRLLVVEMFANRVSIFNIKL